VLLASLIEKYFTDEAVERERDQLADEQQTQALREIFFLTRQLALTVTAEPDPPEEGEEGGSPDPRPRWTVGLSFLNKSMCPYSLGSPIPVDFYVDRVVVHVGPSPGCAEPMTRTVLPGPDFRLTHAAQEGTPVTADIFFQPRFQHAPARLQHVLSQEGPKAQVLTLYFDSRLIHD